MKHNYLLLSSFVFISLGVLFSANSGGPASNNNRATGAPGDGANTCTSCHAGGTFGVVSIDLALSDGGGGQITEYTPGQSYAVSIQVSSSSGSPAGYGFQAVALEDAGNTSLNSFSDAGSGVQFSTSSSRQYAEHTGAVASGTFDFVWVAPAAGTGDVTFYVGANAVNGNGNNGGDNAALANFTFSEMADTTDTNSGDPNGLFEIAHFNVLSVYPNPAVDRVQVKGVTSNAIVEVYSIKGELVMTDQVRNGALDIARLESGVYLLRSEQAFGRFLKL